MGSRSAKLRVVVAVALVVGMGGCGKGCSSCSPMAKVADPLEIMPDDAVVLLELDVQTMENDAVFRSVVGTFLDDKGCLPAILLTDVHAVTVAMPDVVPDSRTFPRVVVTTSGSDPKTLLECVGTTLFPDSGQPLEEEHRGVVYYGFPEQTGLRVAVINKSMIAIAGRDDIHLMVDTYLDGKPSLATSGKFEKLRGQLPKGAQIRLMAMPGEALRTAVRQNIESPWSALLDADPIVAGMLFRPSGIRLHGFAATRKDPARVARVVSVNIESMRQSKIMMLLGVSALLSEVHFSGTGNRVEVSATASEKTVTRILDGAGKMVDIGL